MLQNLDLWGQRGWHGQDVAGESYHLDALQKVVGQVDDRGREFLSVAELIPEPMNPHDKNAVQVLIDGKLVGHLPREDAKRYANVLTQLIQQGWQPQVGAKVWARMGTEYDYDNRGRVVERQQLNVSVRLDLAEPHMLVPANLAPSATHVMLPLGAAIQVTDEENHMANLIPLLTSQGECWVHTTLHEITETLPRSTKTLVEVRIDAAVVGKLTPKMSSELLPVIRYMDSRDVTTVCRAILKGNQLKADVTLYTARSGEIPAEWLSRPPITTASRRTAEADLVTGAIQQNAQASPWRFNPPPGWPTPPPGWMPPQGWVPPGHLPPAPPGWQWWLPA